MRRLSCFVILALLGALVGCGGGGGGPAAPPPGASGQVSLHLTDSGLAAYQRVFVRIYEVALQSATSSRTVFRDDAGTVVDVRALGPDTGRLFANLGTGEVPVGDYTNASFVVDTRVFLVDTAGAGSLRQFAASLDAGAGRSRLTARLDTPTVSAGPSDLLFDFDLSQFTFDGDGRIVPVIRQITDPALSDPTRFVASEVRGSVVNLAGTPPAVTFDVLQGGRSFRIIATETTLLFNEGPGPNPQLRSSDVVTVVGAFDAGARALRARAIQVASPGPAPTVVARGIPLQTDGDLGSMQLEVTAATGFFPTATEVSVVTDAGTVFKGLGGRTLGREDFFFSVLAAAEIRVEGAFNGQAQLQASRIIIDASLDEFEADAEVEGRALSPSVSARTFAVEAAVYEGIWPPTAPLTVAISEADGTFTALELEDGTPLTTEEFFQALHGQPVVTVIGRYRSGRIEASWVIVNQ